MRLAMTLLVRDEADIIEANLRYHRAQGVDFFVVGDNGSEDGTLEILERYEQAGLVELERLPGTVNEAWSEGRTRLARRTHELGADWVIHNDGDEFWWPVTGDLKQTLVSIPERFGMVIAPRTEFVARPGDASFADRLTFREARCLRPPKAAHRTHPRIVLDHPHPTRIWIENASAIPLEGRPGLTITDTRHPLPTEELVFASTFPIRVLHFPVRSRVQYRRRVELAELAGMLESDWRAGLLAAHESGRLDQVYDELALSDQELEREMSEGLLVEDTDFRDYLAACPDPLDGGGAPAGSRDWPDDRRHRELAELELDAMYALTKYVRRRGGSARRGRFRELKESELKLRRRLRRRERRLESIQTSRWWRLRPRLPGRPRRGGLARRDAD
ncbi:MAG TPA: glycosyltransferase family 2 protein [Solirubrobacterales bacterium]|nr:glycosyltransferase family 2 protein [Solirubrobacterales bacterium]